jgi:hypothetical protein
MDPMRYEVCGRNTLHLVRDLAPRLHLDDLAVHSSITMFICSTVERGAVYLGWTLGIIISTKSRFRRLGMRQIPSLDGPLKASRRLSELVWRPAGRRAKGLRKIEPP